MEVGVPRPLWKGSISFGLVNVPVELYTAENHRRPAFRQLYRKTMAPVREQLRALVAGNRPQPANAPLRASA